MSDEHAPAGGPGPAWLGIGAQRSGTTWLAGLLLEHPRMGLATGPRRWFGARPRVGAGADKELHALDGALLEPMDGDDRAAYRRRFPRGDGVLRGEFTPFYLRALWIPPVAAACCPDDVVAVAVLRDPVERFASALRWYASKGLGRLPTPPPLTRHWIRQRGPDAQWGGMYAPQLDAWAAELGGDALVVLQYERARRDPQGAAERVWGRLGLEPVTVAGADVPSGTATGGGGAPRWDWSQAPGLRERLAACYRRQLDELADRWGIDPSLWPGLTEGAGRG